MWYKRKDRYFRGKRDKNKVLKIMTVLLFSE